MIKVFDMHLKISKWNDIEANRRSKVKEANESIEEMHGHCETNFKHSKCGTKYFHRSQPSNATESANFGIRFCLNVESER